MNTNIIFGLGQGRGVFGEGAAQVGRFGWKMRSTALVVALTSGGLPLALNAARCEQARRIAEANKPRVVNELRPGTTDKLSPEQWAQVDAQRAKAQAAKQAKKPDVRVLSAAEMAQWKGSGPYRNKYCAGTLPWHRSLRDVNLCNGNLFKSFTDVQVSPGRGAGLALQRTYNSQDDRPGAFGTGWTHAYDIRMEEENPSTNETSDSLNVADRTDFFGGKHKYHRDADGLYSRLPTCSMRRRAATSSSLSLGRLCRWMIPRRAWMARSSTS